jgi:predicted 3-demethylubiquinone-9 3-methyltransferase (glyoxalase superfamily)
MPKNSSPIVPCLWLDDQAEQAANFYIELFPRGQIVARSYYPESADNPPGKPRGSLLTVEFEIAGQRFTALNGGPQFTINPSISFFAIAQNPAEADRLYAALSEGGEALMPLGEYPWSKRYAWVKDRFGVSWQIMAGEPMYNGAVIIPCIMFSGPQHGRASAAIESYVRAFDGQIMCRDQAEVDHYWTTLSEGGEEGPCGWLKDRFGVSWQVVPERINAWLTSQDRVARDRAFDAVMRMKKLDIAAIQAAYEGR